MDVSGGIAPEDARFSFEVRGSDGWLALTGGHPFGFQASDLTLTASVPFAPPEAPLASGGLMDAAINVGEVYAQLAHDLREGTRETASFAHAARMLRLIDAVGAAARTGTRQHVTDAAVRGTAGRAATRAARRCARSRRRAVGWRCRRSPSGRTDGIARFAATVPDQLDAAFGRREPDSLVNNAGTPVSAPFTRTTAAPLDELVRAHVKAPFFLTQAWLPLMVDGGAT